MNSGAPAARSRLRVFFQALADLACPPMCAICSRSLSLVDDFRHPAAYFCPECRELLEFLPKAACRVCGRPLFHDPADEDSPARICGDCLKEPPAYQSTRSALVYAGTAARSLVRLKYHGDRAQVRVLAALAGPRLTGNAALPDLIIPVPLSERRLAERGFNQSLELALAIYRPWRRLVDDRALGRLTGRDQAPQAALSAEARRRAIRGCFRAPEPSRLKGARVLLFDDVLTTGATAGEAARTLLAAGAARVDLATVARTILTSWR